MKTLFSFILAVFSLIVFSPSHSQTTAMDFEQNDCEGNPHHLYAELDAGRVIVLEFIMLNCAPCINGTKALENLIKPYESTHPGRVHIYSFGFLNSYTCEQIMGWKSDNKFTHPVFNNGEEQVDYYGGMGMPTIVILGTNEHKVFFKSIGYTPAVDDEIVAALDSALLYTPSSVAENASGPAFMIYPTFFSDKLTVRSEPETNGATLIIFDAQGREVISEDIPAGTDASISCGQLPEGMYFARLTGKDGSSEVVKLVRE